jgi:tRNA nucleotidyltransferase/poly(A) polymerase
MPKIFKVGGCVRDGLLGVKTKDIDFTFVLDDLNKTVEEGFKEMEQWMIDQGFTIFLSVPEMFTIRAKFPSNHKFAKLDADFVMARKEVGYVEGTRRPILELGTLEDDLVRRDFTVNAMAEDEDGNLIDLFNGLDHLKFKILITPLDTNVTFNDDPLRLLRALRFSITKDFRISNDIWNELNNFDYDEKMGVVSTERIREELLKCFKHDTLKTLNKLNEFKYLRDYIFKNNILWLKPTFEQ